MLNDKQVNHSNLLGPMERGKMRGGESRLMNPGDIAIIPKGVAHPWSKIPAETIDYLVFRNDPEKVMQVK
jgi:quercetin dioxygenase-like cupin family protein